MKSLKMLGLAVVAAVALTALAGAGSASAAVLCKTNTNPCGSKWAAGTNLEFSLKSGTSALWKSTEGLTLKTCTNAKLTGQITSAGSGTEPVKIKVTEDSWTSCTVATVTLKLGEIEISNNTGTTNGTVVLKGAEFTTNDAFFGDCSYGTAAGGTDLGTLTSSSIGDSVIDVNAQLLPVGGACCPDVVWQESFTITSPKETPLFVEPS
jgi:hypothetical protein